MKQSDLKLLRERMQKAVTPPPKKTEADRSDDLAKLFDDGTTLKSSPITPATQGTSGTLPTHGSQGTPTAPARDFHKVANSIHRQAVPAGLFKGKSKQIYDYLYARTRGAIVPTRTVQVSRREIMEAAHIGSDKTIRENLSHLRAVGLIDWGGENGAQGGCVYTVFLPEETGATSGTLGARGTVGSPGPNLPAVPEVETTQGTLGTSPALSTVSGEAKTSFKDKREKDDDEAAPLRRAFFEMFERASKEITGRELNPAEASKWSELAEVLTTELRIAAGRTTVSSVPAFLAEHLRRRLWKTNKRELDAQAAEEAKRPVAADSAPAMDISQCPDCFGGNYFYPDGYDKGVRRCRHERLTG